MDKTTNVVLIGMPGAGKSTVGVVLAKMLGRIFVDTDIVIQEKYGKLLSELITENGADGFVSLENDTIKEFEAAGAVIATGGSAVFGKDAMTHLKSTGKVIYLKLPYEVLKERLGDLDVRGVVTHGGSLEDILVERAPLYEKYADITIECSSSIEQTLQLCIDALNNI